ncbi:MAG: TonB-dependent receptor plug domain-containing protein [Rhodothermaceae bacterium]|nr:TonB-dependent receptor plug domain-containing protein [Rhodothermaceae bacterium]
MTQLSDYFNMQRSSFPDAVGVPFCRSFQLRVAAALACAVMFLTSPALIGSVRAQLQADTYTVSGTVADAQNGESLVGATIFVPAFGVGSTTNQYGFFSISLPADSVTLVFGHLGYEPATLTRLLNANLRLDVTLEPSTLFLDEVAVVATAGESNVQETQMSQVKLPISQIEALPALLGEVDILKVVQLLPGVQSGVEGTTGIYVWGGGPDQNLFLLDGTQIYNPSHVFGFLSTFNGDAIKDVSLLKGGFPARYGGRLSSVVDLTMKEGNLKNFEGTASIGLLSSRFTFEGPIKRDKASFLIAARRSYADLLARPIMAAASDNIFGYYFYDFNAKGNIILSGRDRIYISSYAGHDRAYFKFKSQYPGEPSYDDALGWRNWVMTLRWNRVLGPRMFANTIVGYTRYRLLSKSEEVFGRDYYETAYVSGIQDIHARIDLEYITGTRHYMRFGVGGILHDFQTGALTERYDFGTEPPVDTTYTPNSLTKATEFQAYFEDEVRLSQRVKVNAGVHASGFLVEGERYMSVQPRLSLWFGLDDRSSLKASLATMQQYIHLLATTRGLSLPTDLWVPATDRVSPQQAFQAAVGYARTLWRDRFDLTLEGFYKRMNDLIEYTEGASYLDAAFGSWEDKVTSGRGVSYGGEVLIRKKSGRTTGWIGYTLSRSDREFESLNRGRVFPYRYDRRHDVSVVVSHRIRPTLDLSATWVYGTGQAITLPVGQLVIANDEFAGDYWNPRGQWRYRDILSDRNAVRMPAYHRLDLSIRWHKQRTRTDRTLSLGVYNAYSRRNAFSVYLDRDWRTGHAQFKKISLLPIVPSIVYQLKF